MIERTVMILAFNSADSFCADGFELNNEFRVSRQTPFST